MDQSEIWYWLVVIWILSNPVIANHIHLKAPEAELLHTDEMFRFTSAINFSSSLFDSSQRYKRQIAFIPFGDLLRQRIEGNNIAQCPCVMNPDSNRCIPYDSRYQAASIEEAIVSFPDVSMDPRILEQTSGTLLDGNAFACKTLECQTCALLLSQRLRDIGLLSSNDFLGVPLPQFVQPELCRRFRFARSLRSPQPPFSTPNFVKEAIDEGLRRLFPTNLFTQSNPTNCFSNTQLRSRSFRTNFIPRNRAFGRTTSHVQRNTEARTGDQITALRVTDEKNAGDQPMPTRVSRQSISPASQHRLLGRTYTISCVERGEVENDETDLLNLCGVCWTWRQLPQTYFPRLVNELVCKDAPDDYCLSGWGTCYQRYRNIDVLHRIGDLWKPAVISLASFCDCKVKAGTQIYALVVGKKN